MLSSRSEAKQDARYVARLDVLGERVDTLASTVATTASAIAKKDGEIAALQRAIEARDQTLQALVQYANRTTEATAADVPVDASELRSLRNAVAALTKERAEGVSAAHVQALVATVQALDQRVAALAAAAAVPPPTDPATTARIDALTDELGALKFEVGRPPEELVAMVSELRGRIDGLAELELVTEDRLDQRVGAADEALATQARRLDTLGTTLEELAQASDAAQEQLARHRETDDALAALDRRLEALGTRLGGLESAQADQDELLANRLDTTRDALTSLSRRLDALPSVDEARFDRRADATDEAVSALAERIDALRVALGGLERAYTADESRVGRRLEGTDEAVATLTERLDALVAALGALEHTHASERERIDHRLRTTTEDFERLSQRIDAIHDVDEAELARRRETDDALAALDRRLDALGKRLGGLESQQADQDELLASRIGSTNEALTTLSRRVAEVSSVDGARLDRRVDATDEVVAALGERIDAFARTVESATGGLHDRERELATLQRHFTESSTRIESIVDDLRDALGAFPEAAPDTLTTFAVQLEEAARSLAAVTSRVERLESVHSEQLVAELAARLDHVDAQVASVAADIARAKTLWPVALRSLEARLDDVVPRRSSEPRQSAGSPEGARSGQEPGADDLLAGLRESLHAMENVATDMEHTSDGIAHDALDAPSEQHSVVGGARVVPLRTGDP